MHELSLGIPNSKLDGPDFLRGVPSSRRGNPNFLLGVPSSSLGNSRFLLGGLSCELGYSSFLLRFQGSGHDNPSFFLGAPSVLARPSELFARLGSFGPRHAMLRIGRSPVRGLTIHSSRSRFAARLNSGVRPLSQLSEL